MVYIAKYAIGGLVSFTKRVPVGLLSVSMGIRNTVTVALVIL